MHTTRNIKEKCVMARIMRDNKKYQKNFSLKNFKTWEAAEEAASLWIEELKKTLPPSRTNEWGRLTKRNKSGVAGISLSRKVENKASGFKYEYWRWVTRWPNCPHKGGMSWTINEETPDADAFALAYLSREMECVDRKKVIARLRRLRGTKKLQSIMDQKAIEVV